MSALTPRKMREIDAQYREMVKKRARKVFLTVFCDVRTPQDTFVIPARIMNSIREMEGVESTSYTDLTSVITIVAQWKDSEVSDKVEEIKEIPFVLDVKTQFLTPRF